MTSTQGWWIVAELGVLAVARLVDLLRGLRG